MSPNCVCVKVVDFMLCIKQFKGEKGGAGLKYKSGSLQGWRHTNSPGECGSHLRPAKFEFLWLE